MAFLGPLEQKDHQDLKANRPSVVRRGTRVLQGILASLGPQDPQDQLAPQATDRRESLVQRAPKEFLEPVDPLEKPVLREKSVF